MEKLAEFVAEHLNDDTARLMLDRAKWPDTDIKLAVSCIESRRKLRGKVSEWYNEPRLVFPAKLSAEQCSSSATAAYKASFAARIAAATGPDGAAWRLADLTGGLGVDSWFFSKSAEKVLYCEMKPELCAAAEYNFKVLGAGNITVRNCMIVPSACGEAVLSEFAPDIVYLDPARRGEGGRKVFLIEECVPDVLSLRDEIFTHSRNILLKLSPMADISMAASRLGGTCREIHIVSCGGECKELLIWMDREWNGEYSVTACELHGSGCGIFTFLPDEEKSAVPEIAARNDFEQPGFLLFEPGKSLMKAGAFNLLSERYGLRKLGKSTHYYIMDDVACGKPDATDAPEKSAGREMSCESVLPAGRKMSGKSSPSAGLGEMGKFFRVTGCRPLDKRSIKEAGAAFPDADVTARNIPMDTEALRKKLSANAPKASASSKCPNQMQKPHTAQENRQTGKPEQIHIFGLKSDTAGNLLLTTHRSIAVSGGGESDAPSGRISSGGPDGEGQGQP